MNEIMWYVTKLRGNKDEKKANENNFFALSLEG